LKRYRLTLIPGDGIGPEVVGATVRILEEARIPIDWDEVNAGAEVYEREGETLPERVLDSIRTNRVALKGPLATPIGKGFTSVNVRLRKRLDLYANLRPTVSLPGVASRYADVDLVVVRENTQDLYAGYESQLTPGTAVAMKIITDVASRRIARFAFEHCRFASRRKVTAVHKASIMRESDGMFLRLARDVAKEYPFIVYEEVAIDQLAMRIVDDPHAYDVLLLPNLFGDIVSDICAGFVGGLGMVPGANLGEGHAVFEAVHGSAPDIAGQGLANPTAVLLSALMMLEHSGERAGAQRIHRALCRVLERGEVRTRDLGGSATTEQYAQAIIDALDDDAEARP
jgi:isocitrate dehydrogenase (NAD+)